MTSVQNIRKADQLYIFERTGTVVSHQNWSETSVSSTTGGDLARPTTTVSSTTTEVLRVFVREDDGDEFEAKLSDPGFGVRDGHRISLVYAGDQMSKRGYPMALVNHATSQQSVLKDRAEWLVRRPNAMLGCLALVGLPFIAMISSPLIIVAVFGLPALLLGDGFIDALPDVDIFSAGFFFAAVTFVAVFVKFLSSKNRDDRLRQLIVTRLQAQVQESIKIERSRRNEG